MAVPFDPDDLAGVRQALEASLSSELGTVKVVDGPLRLGGGLDTYTFGFQLTGEGLAAEWTRPLVLRIYPAAEQEEKARREASVQSFVVEAGYPAPRPLLVKGPGSHLRLPFMVMERVPGTAMLDRFKNPLAITRCLRLMAALHARLHRLPVTGCPLPYERPLVDSRLAEMRGRVDQFRLPGFRKPIEWLTANRETVAREEPALLHNDFHPLNLMHSNVGTYVLDWSDAALGDRHHDVARTLALFWLAPPLARGAAERLLLTALRGFLVRRYVACYTADLPLEEERLRYWGALHAAMAWTQVAVLAMGRGEEMGARPEAAYQVPPGFERSLRNYFWRRALGQGRDGGG